MRFPEGHELSWTASGMPLLTGLVASTMESHACWNLEWVSLCKWYCSQSHNLLASKREWLYK